MPNLDPLAVSASALAAQRTRLNVITENLANANTTRMTTGGPYQRKIVRFESEGPAFASLLAGEGRSRGVRVAEVAAVPGAVRVYHPGHPDADGSGYVNMPNVNPIVEMTDLMAATRAYEANVSAIQAAKSMAQKALEIGR
jgi:flagellar basal-body rod protein FlgC